MDSTALSEGHWPQPAQSRESPPSWGCAFQISSLHHRQAGVSVTQHYMGVRVQNVSDFRKATWCTHGLGSGVWEISSQEIYK